MNDLICIVCPNGCQLQVTQENDEIIVTGAKCKRGIEFAKQELLKPMRSISTTVKTKFQDYPVVSVKTSSEIDKSVIFDVMNEINQIELDHPVSCGEVIIKNVFNTSVDIISTTEMNI